MNLRYSQRSTHDRQLVINGVNEGCPGSEGFESLPRQVKRHRITIDPDEVEVRKSLEGEFRVPAKSKSGIHEDRSRLLDRRSQDREDALPHDRHVAFDRGHGSVQLQVRTKIERVTMVPPVRASEASSTARSRTACLVAREGAVAVGATGGGFGMCAVAA